MDRDEILDICTYIATSAAALKDEPKAYGPLRLMEALSRLVELMGKEYEDSFLKEIVEEVNSQFPDPAMREHDRSRPMRETPSQFLEQLVIKLVRERKQRQR